ncbi:hypothetical protein RRG08_011628, partial [Elysia crispata]
REKSPVWSPGARCFYVRLSLDVEVIFMASLT